MAPKPPTTPSSGESKAQASPSNKNTLTTPTQPTINTFFQKTTSDTKKAARKKRPSPPSHPLIILVDSDDENKSTKTKTPETKPATKKRKASTKAINPPSKAARSLELSPSNAGKKKPPKPLQTAQVVLDQLQRPAHEAHNQEKLNCYLGKLFEECPSEVVHEYLELSQTKSSPEISTFFARHLQGNSQPLAKVCEEIHDDLSLQTPMSMVEIEMKIKQMAKRTAYGIRPRHVNEFEDETKICLWFWEVVGFEVYFEPHEIKLIKESKAQRRRRGAYVKALAKAISWLQESTESTSSLHVEEAKIAKYESDLQEYRLKVQAREKRQEEKQQKMEQKALKLKLKLEKEVEKLEEEKRRQEEKQKQKDGSSLLMFFSPTSRTKPKLSSEVVSITSAQQQEIDKRLFQEDEAPDVSVALATHLERVKVQSKRQIKTLRPLRMKLLQFHQNYRPAYYGTHCRKDLARLTRGLRATKFGRRPYGKINDVDYANDSDEDWEEEEPGESLSGNEEEEEDENDENELDYEDKWLAFENEVEYASDREEESDRPTTSFTGERIQSKASKVSKPKVLQPVILGPFIFRASACPSEFESYKMEILHRPEKVKRCPAPVEESKVKIPEITSFFKKKTNDVILIN